MVSPDMSSAFESGKLNGGKKSMRNENNVHDYAKTERFCLAEKPQNLLVLCSPNEVTPSVLKEKSRVQQHE